MSMSLDDPGDNCEDLVSRRQDTLYEQASWDVGELIQKPAEEWEMKDLMSVTFQSIDDAEQFYNSYAYIRGFSIRKDRMTMLGNIVGMRNFVCSRAGFRRIPPTNAECSSTANTRLVTRCGCLASFKVKYSVSNNLYHPVEFNTFHNHDLVPSKYSHCLPSHRKVDEYSAHQISELRTVGIKPSKIMNVLVNSAGGYEWVGFTRKDLYNHVYRSQREKEKKNDTHLAMQYIQAVASKDPGVYCKYVADEECRLTRIFYADTISRTEYRAFGDVIVCDSTYHTNQFKLPFVFIVGVDNHHSTVVFACALVSNETHETYNWIFQTFLDCMEGKQPTSVITDGDLAMRSALAQVMPRARHRLCGWHILRNANGVCNDPTFKQRLNRLINKRYPVPVFSHKWRNLLQEYGLDCTERKWVTDMQQSCHLWAETFFPGCFYAGMVTNGRAESTNKTLKGYVNVHLPLSQLFHRYFLFLDELRQNAINLECINSQSMPPMRGNGFESVRTQLANLYTVELYKKVDFEIQREHLFRADQLNLVTDSPKLRFAVQRYDSGAASNHYDVEYCRTTNLFVCTCGLMESCGFPCAHIFASMKQIDICNLGSGNLNRRWYKDARSMCMLFSSCARHVTGPAHRLTTIRPYCETLAFLAASGDEQLQYAQGEIERLCQRLSIMGNGNEANDPMSSNPLSELPDSLIVKDPNVVRTKGAPRVRRGSTQRHCTLCKMPGHTKTTCAIKGRKDVPLVREEELNTIEGSQTSVYYSSDI